MNVSARICSAPVSAVWPRNLCQWRVNTPPNSAGCALKFVSPVAMNVRNMSMNTVKSVPKPVTVVLTNAEKWPPEIRLHKAARLRLYVIEVEFSEINGRPPEGIRHTEA